MDGHFVKNITLGHNIVDDILKHFLSKFIDVHLMIDDPILN